MSTQIVLTAELRSALGKGASRRLRHAGQLPAIVYGGNQEPQALVLRHLELQNLMLKSGEAFYSQVLHLQIGESTQAVVVRDMQRHPFKPFVTHIDFLRVLADRELRVRVPLHFLNESSAPGIKQQGGMVSRNLIDVEITCLPKNLPESISVDLGNLSIGEAIHLSGLQLPPGVELATPVVAGSEQDGIVVGIAHPDSGDTGTDEAEAPAA